MRPIPNILREIPAPPENLFTRGKLIEDNFQGIAVVGTRKASSFGMVLAEKVAGNLALEGFAIISGLAMGIDSAAHRGCLSAGGRTVAVLAAGVNKIYPAVNIPLAEKIISSGGSIISEHEDAPYRPDMFLKRNRIISGLSVAVIVIEAPFKSGAVSTANWAAEQGKEVFVFPGNPGDPNYGGSHKLVRDGARLVSSVEDILEDLGIEKRAGNTPAQTGPLPERLRAVFDVISDSAIPLPVDKIISATKLEPHEVLVSLSELLLSGYIMEDRGGYLSIRKRTNA